MSDSVQRFTSAIDLRSHPHQDLMDRIYRHQRYIYDLTRSVFLLGRRSLLRKMMLPPEAAVLEVGCGTAHNLIRLAKLRRDVRLFGMDASREMLCTAQRKIRRRGLDNRITLSAGLAEHLDTAKMFGLSEALDAVFFSYSLTMIPQWHAAVRAALANLKPGGHLYIVDFWDQAELPRWFRNLLKRWLALFHVHFDPALLDFLRVQQQEGGFCRFCIQSVSGRYAVQCMLQKSHDGFCVIP